MPGLESGGPCSSGKPRQCVRLSEQNLHRDTEVAGNHGAGAERTELEKSVPEICRAVSRAALPKGHISMPEM